MPYVAPTSVSTGDVLTAARYNSDVVANMADLRAVLANVQSTMLTTTTQTTITTGGTFYDISGLSVSFTPTASTYKALVIANVDITCATTDAYVALRLVRGSTAIGVATSTGSRIAATAGAYLGTATMSGNGVHFQIPMQFLDAHASSSAVTYKVQATTNVNGSTVSVNRSSVDADSSTTFRATSTITVIEVPV